jgi:hypothetical protein
VPPSLLDCRRPTDDAASHCPPPLAPPAPGPIPAAATGRPSLKPDRRRSASTTPRSTGSTGSSPRTSTTRRESSCSRG